MRAICRRQKSLSAGETMGVVRKCTARISARPASSGKGTTTLLDRRPGLVRAGSNTCININVYITLYMMYNIISGTYSVSFMCKEQRSCIVLSNCYQIVLSILLSSCIVFYYYYFNQVFIIWLCIIASLPPAATITNRILNPKPYTNLPPSIPSLTHSLFFPPACIAHHRQNLLFWFQALPVRADSTTQNGNISCSSSMWCIRHEWKQPLKKTEHYCALASALAFTMEVSSK